MRIDIYLHENGFCDSRNKAKALIDSGRVSVNNKTIAKASFEVCENDKVKVEPSGQTEFVGRGGLKLEHAFEVFSIDAKDKICADIGASTGGFTQCLLLHGAKKVYAIDSGTGQLAKKLCDDERVVSLEGVNARYLTSETLGGERPSLIVMDVSFISQTLLFPAILDISESKAYVVTLVKPQFEVGRSGLGKNGVVKDEKLRKKALLDVSDFALACGFDILGTSLSPITGQSGNTEYLLYLRKKQ